MLCVVIKGSSWEEMEQQMVQALPYADLLELRLDALEKWQLAPFFDLRARFPLPLILTLRSASQGGLYRHSEKRRQNELRQLAALDPKYVDVEAELPVDFVRELRADHPQIQWILSHHDFKRTPSEEELETLYRQMREHSADFYKLAVMAPTATDGLRFCHWARRQEGALIALSMGMCGQVTRIAAPLTKSPWTYASLQKKVAPGQVSAQLLCERYRYKTLNQQTELYALIGNPIEHSLSDQLHNPWFSASGSNAVYLKIPVLIEELPAFLLEAKRLPFRGMSVTMPLKEAILPLLDERDSEATAIGAVNTLIFKEGKVSGYNTDGKGALVAIEQIALVADKHVVVIGAGGSARAIAYEAKKRGARVTVLNRTAERALGVAQQLRCRGGGLEDLPLVARQGCDVLVNCTPDPPLFLLAHVQLETLVMDIRTHASDGFLLQATQKGCRTIPGLRMLTEQALCQAQLWAK